MPWALRNAASILKAIEVQLRFSQPLPKQTIEHQGAVSYTVVDPYALPPADEIDVTPVKPPAKAIGPTIRRNGEVI